MAARQYARTHPWLTFELDLGRLSPEVWMLLGEARSKGEHLAGVPLRPAMAEELNRIYLAKGIAATTAIEGNTLSEKEVELRIRGELTLPPSKEYLAREVDNVLAASNRVWDAVQSGRPLPLTPDLLLAFNRQILAGLELSDEVVAGEYRHHDVGVARYRGAPPRDCPYLVERLCQWLNETLLSAQRFEPGRWGTAPAILAAIVAHLYIAWIHPFGDGNGRTARMVEYAILVSAGLPRPTAHLLSNHYNQTRAEYYRQLDHASRSGGDTAAFIQYALQGLVDGLREQVQLVRRQQIDVAWRNFVHEEFGELAPTEANKRRRDLVLDLSTLDESIGPAHVQLLNARTARAYANRSAKTLMRDLEHLQKMGLLLVEPTGRVRANKALIEAFLPMRTSGHGPASRP
jgi:Fic family protein